MASHPDFYAENTNGDIHPYDSASNLHMDAPASNLNSYHQPHVQSSLRDSYAKKPQPKFCCGCFRTRRTCCRFYTIFFILLGITIGLLVFFLYPRIPTITISGPILARDTLPFAISAEAQPLVTINVLLNIDVNSQNYVPFDIKYTIILLVNLKLSHCGWRFT